MLTEDVRMDGIARARKIEEIEMWKVGWYPNN
jgi:hypothetical protein